MSESSKSFADLVAAAPEAPAGDTVSLVGTLSRSADQGKFVLNMGDGRAVTLDIAAVKNHAVLGSSVGQQIVRVDVDPKSLPAEIAGKENTNFKPVADTAAALDRPFTNPDIDHPLTLPRADYTVSYLDMPHTYLFIDLQSPGTGFADVAGGNTVVEGFPDPTGGGGLAPFALAAAQQVPEATLAALGVHPPLPMTGYPDIKHPIWDRKALIDSGATNIGSRFLD